MPLTPSPPRGGGASHNWIRDGPMVHHGLYHRKSPKDRAQGFLVKNRGLLRVTTWNPRKDRMIRPRHVQLFFAVCRIQKHHQHFWMKGFLTSDAFQDFDTGEKCGIHFEIRRRLTIWYGWYAPFGLIGFHIFISFGRIAARTVRYALRLAFVGPFLVDSKENSKKYAWSRHSLSPPNEGGTIS